MSEVLHGIMLAHHESGEWHILKADGTIIARFPTEKEALDAITNDYHVHSVLTLMDETDGKDRSSIEAYIAEKQKAVH